MSPVELQAMCERAVEARTRQIVKFMEENDLYYESILVKREFLDDPIRMTHAEPMDWAEVWR